MSVEVKEINKSGGFSAEWDNICRLYRLQLVQKQLMPMGLLIYLIISFFTIALFNQVSLITMPDDLDYIRGIGGTLWVYLLILTFIIAVSDYNILSAENISIYPGTVRTRFISRLFLDYTMFFVIIASSVICNIIGVGISNLIILLMGNDSADVLFDLKTLLFRSIAFLCYMLMIHSAYILLHVIVSKIGIIKSAAALTVIGITTALLLKFTPLMQHIKQIAKFYGRPDLGLANVALRTLLTSAVLLIISFTVMSTIHTWMEINKNVKLAFSIFLSYILIMAVSIGGSLFYTIVSTSTNTAFPEDNLETLLQNKTLISNDYKIKPGISDGILINESYSDAQSSLTSISDMNANIAWMNLDKAVKRGMVPADTKLSEGEMLVRVVSSTYKYKDKYLYKNFIENVKFNIVDSECKLDINKNMTVYDAFLFIVDSILGDDVKSIGDFGEKYFTIENCQIYVIFNKGDIKNPKELESMYGGYTE